LTSAVTIEDIESELWRAGIRSARVIDDLLRLVRLYRLAAARQDPACPRCLRMKSWVCLSCLGASEDASFTCTGCGRSKHASDFYRRRDLTSGYSRKCKNCHDQRSTCRTCGKRWQAAHLQDSQCPPCREGPSSPTGRYLCRKCGGRKVITEFPEGKQEDPSRQFWCADCTARYGKSRP
jgi:hypothetical protein